MGLKIFFSFNLKFQLRFKDFHTKVHKLPQKYSLALGCFELNASITSQTLHVVAYNFGGIFRVIFVFLAELGAK